MRGLVILALGFVLAGGVASAHAGLNFDFSFTNTDGNVSGTVTGEIFGLTDNSTSAATDIVIDSYPAALTLPAAPWDIFDDGSLLIVENSFTVAGGAVTAAGFDERNVPVNFALNAGGTESVLEEASAKYVINDGGFAAITFTPASSPSDVPEPASIALLLSGLCGLRTIRRRKG